MEAIIKITSDGKLRIEGNVKTSRDTEFKELTILCDGGSITNNLPWVYIDSTMFNHFERIEITGNLKVM